MRQIPGPGAEHQLVFAGFCILHLKAPLKFRCVCPGGLEELVEIIPLRCILGISRANHNERIRDEQTHKLNHSIAIMRFAIPTNASTK